MGDDSDDTYDLAVIGAGSGGMAAARRAREAELSVVQFEHRSAGGTCVNRGCVPKKLLVHAARQGEVLHESESLGWSTGEIGFDWPALRDKVDREVRELGDSQRESLIEAGVDYVGAEARLVAPDTVRTDEGREYRARHVIVASGSRPLVPDLPGVEHTITSDDLFTLDELPGRIAMVGGGYIAVEFACLLHRFGVEVTIFESGERILEGFEPETVERLQTAMRGSGITIHTDAKAARIEKDDDGLALELQSGERHAGFGEVALVVGRAPNSDDLGLEEIGVALDDKGQIEVDDHGRTSVAGVHAIGDVARALQLTPVAVADGHNVVDGIRGRAFAPIRAEHVPTAVYATPELGSVGLDEDAARERGIAFDVRRADFAPLNDRLSERDRKRKVLIKLLVERGSGTLLGLHALGERAAETAQLAAVLIEGGVTETALHRAIALHPTDAEEIVGLGRGERERATSD